MKQGAKTISSNNGSDKTNRSPFPSKEDFFTAISVDCVIFGLQNNELKILLIKSDYPDYLNRWSLLGDLIGRDETLGEAAHRVLNERTGLENIYLEQVACFSEVDRHPEGRVISVAYYALVNIDQIILSRHDNELHWHSMHNVGTMAFDHNEILETCLRSLQSRLKVEPVGFNLLPEKFSLRELQSLYESVLMIDLDRRNFRKKFLSTGLLIDLHEYEHNVPRRPAKLFKFNTDKYEQFKNKGNFQ